MQTAGIEAMNAFGGRVVMDVHALAQHRQLDMQRFDNLLMKEKSLALPNEDPVTFAVNAAKPVIDNLSAEDCDAIELLITCTESGIDFGKSLSTYVHHHLGLAPNCRLFEIKQACYAATAGLQMAINFILSGTSPGAKALVIATDISRFVTTGGGETLSEDWSYFEPSAGAGAVAMLVSETPYIFQVDIGANGYIGDEVMDTCRPVPDSESGNVDLSLMSYLEACQKTFAAYQRRVPEVDYRDTFQYLAFHTPFGGMVKGAHRLMMRKFTSISRGEVETDFQTRVVPGLSYCQRVGNIMGGTIMLALAGTIDHGDLQTPKRVGLYSYGSGCCAEFYSGIITADSQNRLRQMALGAALDRRYQLSIAEYEEIFRGGRAVRFGTRDTELDPDMFPPVRATWSGQPLLLLRRINEYHREYIWTT